MALTRFLKMILFTSLGFTLPFYKRMLNKKLTMKDIESVDPEYYNSLVKKNSNHDQKLELIYLHL